MADVASSASNHWLLSRRTPSGIASASSICSFARRRYPTGIILLRVRQLIVDYLAAPGLQIADHKVGSALHNSDVDGDGASTVYVPRLSRRNWSSRQLESGTPAAGERRREINLPPGHYFPYASTAIGTRRLTVAVVLFIVTDGLEAIHARCLDAVQARIRMLLLDGLSDERIIVEKLPINAALRRRTSAIVLSPQTRIGSGRRRYQQHKRRTACDVLVTIIDRDNQEPTLVAQLDQHLALAATNRQGISATGGCKACRKS